MTKIDQKMTKIDQKIIKTIKKDQKTSFSLKTYNYFFINLIKINYCKNRKKELKITKKELKMTKKAKND